MVIIFPFLIFYTFFRYLGAPFYQSDNENAKLDEGKCQMGMKKMGKRSKTIDFFLLEKVHRKEIERKLMLVTLFFPSLFLSSSLRFSSVRR